MSRVPIFAVVCTMLLASGCGSSSRSAKPAHIQDRAQTVATDPATIEGVGLGLLPAFPKPDGTPPVGTVTDAGYLESVFNRAQTTWEGQFKAAGLAYQPARLVFYSEPSEVGSFCRTQAQAGPFYCGAGLTVYLDRRFLDLLSSRVDGNAFAGAYLVSQLLGRHVQRVTGIELRVGTADRLDPGGQPARIQNLALQANCLSGVWAHSVYTRAQLTGQDVDAALAAITATGHEFLTKVGDVGVETDLWTQTRALRAQWFDTGFTSGEPSACRTFSATP
jgi:uncharacterized protein